MKKPPGFRTGPRLFVLFAARGFPLCPKGFSRFPPRAFQPQLRLRNPVKQVGFSFFRAVCVSPNMRRKARKTGLFRVSGKTGVSVVRKVFARRLRHGGFVVSAGQAERERGAWRGRARGGRAFASQRRSGGARHGGREVPGCEGTGRGFTTCQLSPENGVRAILWRRGATTTWRLWHGRVRGGRGGHGGGVASRRGRSRRAWASRQRGRRGSRGGGVVAEAGWGSPAPRDADVGRGVRCWRGRGRAFAGGGGRLARGGGFAPNARAATGGSRPRKAGVLGGGAGSSGAASGGRWFLGLLTAA